MKFSPKYLFYGAFIGVGLLLGIIKFLPDNKLHIVFCDVGQGDAIYVRFPDQKDMLVDGGPNDKVLSCLGQYMPFYDRKIDLIIATHPQADHINGLLSVVNRYQVGYFLSDFNESSDNKNWQKILTVINTQKIPRKDIYSGMTIKLDSAGIIGLWPDKTLLAQNILGIMSDTQENSLSPYLIIKYGNFKTLLTGDGDQITQKQLLNAKTIDLGQIQVLKVPHHGSKTSLLREFIEIIQPQLSIISVGKNSYGHPASEIVKLLENFGKVYRTDQQGNIEVVSDGNGFWINR